ncbi:MAG: ribonuclease Z [Rhizobacter sp.]|nr:ribonuclease Z [Rhizobacter sp.]
MRTTFDLRLVDASGGEPGLVADLRDERRALLFDLAELSHLAPRVLLRCSHAFVTHAHMDHFAGFDHLLALGLGRVSRLVLWGGPGFIDRVDHKLQAYTWNVVHRYEPAMRLEVHPLEADGTHAHASFDSREAFVRRELPRTVPSEPALLVDEPLFSVRAVVVDHEMPVLAFALDEKAQLRVAADRIAAMGLTTGPWLAELKRAVLAGAPDDTHIELVWHDRAGEHRQARSVGELRPLVLDRVPGRRIGYVTDLRFTEGNIAQLARVLTDVDLLHIESVFLDADRDHALRKNHLTARQAGEIARRLGARQVVPFHFSPRYRGREAELRAEVAAAHRPASG